MTIPITARVGWVVEVRDGRTIARPAVAEMVRLMQHFAFAWIDREVEP